MEETLGLPNVAIGLFRTKLEPIHRTNTLVSEALFRYTLGLLTKQEIKEGVTILQSRSTEMLWIKLDKSFFKLKNNLFICVTYLPPKNSTCTQRLDFDIFNRLEQDIIKYLEQGKVILLGDFNSRTGVENDFIFNDSTQHIPVYDQYREDCSVSTRLSQDEYLDSDYGRKLFDLCIANQLRILNGRSLFW